MQTKTVKTYYMAVKAMPGEPPTLVAWRDNWRKRGWTPHVLTETDAARHPKYPRYRTHCEAFPTVNPKEYEMACWMRWLAFAQVGGGLMTDFDVVNRNYPQVKMLDEPENVIILSRGRVPCAVIATKAGAERIVDDVLNHAAKFDNHYSDMYFFQQTSYPHVELCIEAGDRDWEQAPLVHFSHNACNVNKLRRVEGMRGI